MVFPAVYCRVWGHAGQQNKPTENKRLCKRRACQANLVSLLEIMRFRENSQAGARPACGLWRAALSQGSLEAPLHCLSGLITFRGTPHLLPPATPAPAGLVQAVQPRTLEPGLSPPPLHGATVGCQKAGSTSSTELESQCLRWPGLTLASA